MKQVVITWLRFAPIGRGGVALWPIGCCIPTWANWLIPAQVRATQKRFIYMFDTNLCCKHKQVNECIIPAGFCILLIIWVGPVGWPRDESEWGPSKRDSIKRQFIVWTLCIPANCHNNLKRQLANCFLTILVILCHYKSHYMHVYVRCRYALGSCVWFMPVGAWGRALLGMPGWVGAVPCFCSLVLLFSSSSFWIL